MALLRVRPYSVENAAWLSRGRGVFYLMLRRGYVEDAAWLHRACDVAQWRVRLDSAEDPAWLRKRWACLSLGAPVC